MPPPYHCFILGYLGLAPVSDETGGIHRLRTLTNTPQFQSHWMLWGCAETGVFTDCRVFTDTGGLERLEVFMNVP